MAINERLNDPSTRGTHWQRLRDKGSVYTDRLTLNLLIPERVDEDSSSKYSCTPGTPPRAFWQDTGG